MKIYVIIPAHNEEEYIDDTLRSLVNQTLRPERLVVVNDNSEDKTASIINYYCSNYSWIDTVTLTSSNQHLPGAKIIKAFNEGLTLLDSNYDIICKFDADLIFPHNYLEQLSIHFKNNSKLGMASGFCFIAKNDEWILENLTRKDHIRGALKAYRKECFLEIGQLKASMGWDTVDELLAQYYGWEILTDPSLQVKHLKPTAATYTKNSKYLQGEAMYKMRYGIWITCISAAKMAIKKKNFILFRDYIKGYFMARTNKSEFLVTKEQGDFIRHLRWKGMLSKLF